MLTSGVKMTSSNVLSLIDRLEKDAKGSLTTILILGIIKREGKTWGYQIKKTLKTITQGDSYIKDSSLYTSLRNLEVNYKLIKSEIKERRRYYSLTELGLQEIDQIYEYWQNLVQVGTEAFEKLNFPIEKEKWRNE